MGNLTYPMSTEEPRYAGRGLADNRHRRGPVEAITMNVGDPLGRCQGERKYGGGNTPRKPPMRQKGVSVAIVVGGRESRPHGEGPQLARWVRRNPPECEDGAYRSMSGEHSGPQIPLRRRPYAVKAARTVTTGRDGETGHKEPRSVPTHSCRCQQNAKGAVSPIGGGRVR
jgi:hypothetical protein